MAVNTPTTPIEYTLPANVHTAAACVLWSGKITPEDHPNIDANQFEILKRNVKIAVLMCNFVQTMMMIALIYFVIDGSERRQDAKEWTFEFPTSNILSILFFFSFVIAGSIVVERESTSAWTVGKTMCLSWFVLNRNAEDSTPGWTTKVWWFLIGDWPKYLCEFGGFAYMMAFCTRFDSYADSSDYLEYVLNLLAFEFIFSIDDWIFESISTRWKESGIWNDDYLKVEVTARNTITSVDRWHLADTCVFIGFCVCSRIALVVAVAIHFKGFVQACYKSKGSFLLFSSAPMATCWMAFLGLYGTYLVLGEDEGYVPLVCYSIGAAFLLLWMVVVVYNVANIYALIALYVSWYSL